MIQRTEFLCSRWKEPHTSRWAVKKSHTVQQFGTLEKTFGQRDAEHGGTVTPLGETPCNFFRKFTVKETWGPFGHQGNPGTFRGSNSAEFLPARGPSSQALRESSTTLGPRNSHQRRKARTRRLRPTRRSTSSLLHAFQRLGQLLEDKVHGVQTLEASPRCGLRYQTLNGCVICFDTIPKENVKNIIIRDKQKPTQGFTVQWHSYRRTGHKAQRRQPKLERASVLASSWRPQRNRTRTTTCVSSKLRKFVPTQHVSGQGTGFRRPKIRNDRELQQVGSRKPERQLGQKNQIKNPDTLSFLAPQHSRKWRKESIHSNASPESVSMICKLIESVYHLSILIAVAKYMDDLPEKTHNEAQERNVTRVK